MSRASSYQNLVQRLEQQTFRVDPETQEVVQGWLMGQSRGEGQRLFTVQQLERALAQVQSADDLIDLSSIEGETIFQWNLLLRMDQRSSASSDGFKVPKIPSQRHSNKASKGSRGGGSVRTPRSGMRARLAARGRGVTTVGRARRATGMRRAQNGNTSRVSRVMRGVVRRGDF